MGPPHNVWDPFPWLRQGFDAVRINSELDERAFLQRIAGNSGPIPVRPKDVIHICIRWTWVPEISNLHQVAPGSRHQVSGFVRVLFVHLMFLNAFFGFGIYVLGFGIFIYVLSYFAGFVAPPSAVRGCFSNVLLKNL